ncbi:TonB-dependent receptor [Spirosoma aerolatum]|uniref:TonB-dependent receptor n=1 Tax=Spirosoma aerolatum TaxID=1211326 RepID=UPI0009ABB930|nr:TonB-dependent receptor [Spirosoma aerolatum]
MNRLLYIQLVFGWLILLINQAQAQTYRLSGQVLDTKQQPIVGVRLTLANRSLSTLTDSTGAFQFIDLSPGFYQLTTELSDYQTLSFSVTIRRSHVVIPLILRPAQTQLGEVVVKGDYTQARKRDESLNLEVVNPDFIQRYLGGSLMKSLERLPGVKTIGIGSGQSKPLIRGMGFNRIVVVDKGVKHEGQQWGADHGLELDQFAAGEVQLLKGAASFLYGSDAIGGAIDVKPVPSPAPHTLGGSVDLIGKTNNNLYGTSINLFGRTQRWFVDARFTGQRYGDYRVPTDRVYVYDYAVDLDKKRLRNTAGRETGMHLNMGYLNDHFSSIVYVSHTYSQSGFFANAHGLEPRRVDRELHDRSDRDILMPSQQVAHDKLINRSEYTKGNHRLSLELGYQHNFRQEFSQYVNHGYMPPVYPDTLAISPTLERQFDKHVYSINGRDELSLGRHTLTVGFTGERQQNRIGGWSFLVPAFTQTTSGVFGYDKVRLSDQLVLHGALRFDYGQIHLLPYTDWFPSTVTTGTTTVSQRLNRAEELTRTFRSMVWSVGVNYNRETFALKANLGKSFRMPIAKELSANGVNYHYFSYERGDPTLSPEQSYQADLSVSVTTSKVTVQLSPFYNYFPNYIYLNPTAQHDYFYGAGNQVFHYAQSRVMRYGGEIQLKYRLLSTLSTELLGEYVYARQLSGEKQGYTLPFSPPASVLFNLTWSPTLSGKVHNTYFSVDYRLSAAQNRIVPPEKKTPGYGVINLQAGTHLHLYSQPVRISLQAQNLLNTRYFNHTSFYRLIELPEAGRNIILSLTIPFSLLTTKLK